MPKPAVYIETSVVSYHVARASRDVIVLAHQQITQDWWNMSLPHCQPFVSQLVLEEASAGDPEAARKRLEALEPFGVLEVTEEAEKLAGLYLARIPVLAGSARDALHLAIASSARMDYLLTWNCSHIASALVRKTVEEINDSQLTSTPAICTPEELMEFRV
jgi:hypothetical protein